VDKLILCFGAVSLIILFFLTYPFIALTLSADLGLIHRVWEEKVVIKALSLTLIAATLSTAILTFFGVPLAYLLARYEFKGKKLVEAIIDLPLVVPHAVVGIMLLVAFGPRTSFGAMLRSIGVVIEDSFWAIVAVFTFMSAPLLIDTVKDGFASISPSLEGVARSMGASPLYTFFTISLPLTIRSICTGALLAWARAISEVGALLIIAYYPKTINVLIIEWFNTYGLAYAIALTLIMLVISVLVFLVLRIILRWRR